MQAPICEICLKSDILCSACQNKLETNKITKAEIDVSRFVYVLSDKVKSLGDIKIEKVIESNSLIIVAKKGDAAKLVGKGGSVVKALAKQFGKSIKIIEQSGNFKEFMINLLSPINITGINVLYTPSGEVYKIRVTGIQKTPMPMNNEDVIQLASSLFNKQAEIVVEN